MEGWTLSHLGDVPHFADTMADRAWHAWWTDSGVPLSAYRAHLDPMMAPGAGIIHIPMALVAHVGEVYLGSALLIESDLDARPALSPWVAALWVEEAHRRRGIAASLMARCRAKAAALGFATVYLCAQRKVSAYYVQRGWNLMEQDVAGLDVFSMAAKA
jgi:GNAT superfamily N-acetyltransferase